MSNRLSSSSYPGTEMTARDIIRLKVIRPKVDSEPRCIQIVVFFLEPIRYICMCFECVQCSLCRLTHVAEFEPSERFILII